MTDVSQMASGRLSVVALIITVFASGASAAESGYYGKHIGKLKQLHHGLGGDVYAVDARTLHIRDFTYDGEGPAAYFYISNSKTPNGNGVRINDEKGTQKVLKRYRKEHITLTLPEGKTLNNIKWFYVWCDEFSVNFGDVKIPKGLGFPKPHKLESLSGIHGVSSDPVVIVDAQTMLVPNFSYDGEAPDAKFWVGTGSKPNSQGWKVADENGKEVPLRRYDHKTIVLTLPGDMTVFDIGHFGVWCEAFAVDFGHVKIPKTVNVPPSLKMLGVSPQSKLNCEVLWDDLAFEVRWAVAGDSIVLQLVSKLEPGEYMSFGLSGDATQSRMVGGDVVVAWVDKETLKGYTEDYFLDAKSQCAGQRGSCPDHNLREGTNSVRMLNAAMVNGYSIVTYQRPLKAQDELDKNIVTNGSQPIIWAIGPLNSKSEVSYHSLANRENVFLDFGRSPKWNCPLPESSKDKEANSISTGLSSIPARAKIEKLDLTRDSQRGESKEVLRRPLDDATRRPPATPAPVARAKDAWEIPPIQCNEPEDGVFYAQMGPTGGKRGYPAITGHVGWGISWYINGLLIPEINVVRGKTYTFVVEGGLDPETPARYHPFYITDDPVGGYEHKTAEERAEVRVFAGVKQNRRMEVYPSGTGRLCNWTPDQNQPLADEFASFGAYQRTLTLECDEGEPGVVTWTPDAKTPDTVYYQCYTHRYLGWKINVLDSCDVEGAASEQVVSIVAPDDQANDDDDDEEDDLQGRPSIQVNVRVKPNGIHAGGKDVKEKDNVFKGSSNTQTDSYQNYQQDYKFPNHAYKQASDSSNGESSNNGVSYSPPSSYNQHQQMNAQQYSYNHKNQDKGIDEAFVPPPAFQRDVYNQPSQLSEDFQEILIIPVNVTQNEKETTESQRPATPKPTHEKAAASELTEVKIEKPENVPAPQHLRQHHHQQQQQQVSNYGRVPYTVYPVTFNRGPQFTSYRRPVPMYTPPRSSMYRPHYNNMQQPGPQQTYVISQKKPFYRGQSPQMSQHRPVVVPFQRPMMYHQNLQYSSRPPPRIIPLHQYSTSKIPYKGMQMHLKQVKPFSTTPKLQSKSETVTRYPTMVLPSTLINTNKPESRESYQAAVNTGFKPETVIVEGGFRPIISINKDVAQDRSSLVDSEMEFNEQDVKPTEEKQEDHSNEDLNAEEHKENPFEGQQPEMFEPMFIPSPPDRRAQKNKLKSSVPDGLTPPYPNGKRRKTSNNYMTRVRPGLVRRPFYPDNIVPPFRIPVRGGSPTFRQASEEMEEEQAMAAEQQDTYYLPPAQLTEAERVPQEGTAVTYDGKSVVDISLPPRAASNYDTPQNSEDLVRSTPQFGPFRGEIPPPIPQNIRPENIPQFHSQNRQRIPELPIQFQQGDNYEFPAPPPIRSTQLALIRQLEQLEEDGKQVDELLPQASELKDTLSENEETETKESYEQAPTTISEEMDTAAFTTITENTESDEKSTTKMQEEITSEPKLRAGKKYVDLTTPKYEKHPEYLRSKRSADHEPGHVGNHPDNDHHEHDHHDHDHDHHMTPKKDTNGANVATMSTMIVVLLNIAVIRFL